LGTYRLLGRLGKGAQGIVFKGEASDGRLVAIKLLNTRLDKPGLDSERFLREVAAARRVAQFCTAQVLDANMDGEQPYIVSELVDGVSLQVVVQREGPRQGGALYRLAVGTVTALAAIHRAGIVHRDFKPSNVLLGPDGPRVIDFGIARALDSAMTISSGVVGTPAYMSPEQISGERVGPASDLFGWALTMLYAATGRPAFGQDSLPAVIYRVMNDEPDLSALPDELRPLVGACLSKRAEERPAAADALFALLENQGAGAGRDDEVALNTGSQVAAEVALNTGSQVAAEVTPAPPVAPASGPSPTGWANPSGAAYAPRQPPAVAPGGPRPPPQAVSSPRPYAGRSPVPPYAPRQQEYQQQPLAPPYPMSLAPHPGAPSKAEAVRSDNDAFFRHAAEDRPDVAKARRRRTIMVSATLAVALALAGGVLVMSPTMFGTETAPSPDAARATTSIVSSPTPTPTVTPTPTPTQAEREIVAALGEQDGKSFKGHTKGVQTIAAMPMGGTTWLVSGGQDGRVRVWDLATHKSLATMKGHREDVYAVGAMMVGKTPMAVSGGYDGSVRLWNLKTHKGRVLGRHGDAVYAVALVKVGGKYVAVTGDADGWLRFWDLKKRKATGERIRAHHKAVNWLNATRVGDRPIVVSASEDATLRMWDVARHKAYGKAYKGHAKGVYAVASGKIGDRMVIASGGKDRKIRLWDPKTGKTIGSPLSGHKKIIYSLAFGSVGGRSVLLSGSTDGTIRLWDPETRTSLGKPVKAHKSGVYAVGIVPVDGGTAVVSAGKDKLIRVWQTRETPVGS
jgi:WD40 repeat protein/serine/threonine protein kinase